MNLKESFDRWIAETVDADDQSGKDLFFYSEVNNFFQWHEEQQKKPIVKRHSIEDLYEDGSISVRIFNVLMASKIYTLESLANYEKIEIESFRNLGSKSMYDLEKLMKEHGIAFKEI